jgi:UDP-N-acetyl-alpha-D-muramoyl-L-alanyl-L-glutamate epimerase
VDGLGEFAYRNRLELGDVRLEGGREAARVRVVAPTRAALVPFGGGIDSIVTAEGVRHEPGTALFVVGPEVARFEAIERPAAQLALPIVRVARRLDPRIRQSAQEGFLDGHVPVTAIVSALALVAGVARGHDAVLMSNERSASSPNLVVDGRAINHQWSKSLACEDLLRAAVAERLEGGPDYASALRDRSELWVASEFARHERYLPTFMSCNRAFLQAPASRATTWCAACDKCRFTDLVLAPFVPRSRLEAVFGGREPLADPANVPHYEVLCGIVDNPKPFECVGDEEECATALVAAVARGERTDQPHLGALAARASRARPLAELLAPTGPTHARRLDAARDLV